MMEIEMKKEKLYMFHEEVKPIWLEKNISG